MAIELMSQIFIERSPENVWRVLTDLLSYPKWNSSILRMTQVSENKYLEVLKRGNEEMTMSLEITRSIPFKEFHGITRVVKYSWLLKNKVEFNLVAQGNGTLVIRKSRHTGLLTWLRRSSITRIMSSGNKRSVHLLKEVVESDKRF